MVKFVMIINLFAFFSFFLQMEKLIHLMQDEKSGVPIRTVKSFMSKIPSVFTGNEKNNINNIMS